MIYYDFYDLMMIYYFNNLAVFSIPPIQRMRLAVFYEFDGLVSAD